MKRRAKRQALACCLCVCVCVGVGLGVCVCERSRGHGGAVATARGAAAQPWRSWARAHPGAGRARATSHELPPLSATAQDEGRPRHPGHFGPGRHRRGRQGTRGWWVRGMGLAARDIVRLGAMASCALAPCHAAWRELGPLVGSRYTRGRPSRVNWGAGGVGAAREGAARRPTACDMRLRVLRASTPPHGFRAGQASSMAITNDLCRPVRDGSGACAALGRACGHARPAVACHVACRAFSPLSAPQRRQKTFLPRHHTPTLCPGGCQGPLV